MINKILSGIFSIIINLVNLLLTPINSLITNAIPDLTNIFNLIGNALDLIYTYVNWWVDASLLSSETISIIVLSLTLRLTLPLSVNAVKLAVKWYNKIKP